MIIIIILKFIFRNELSVQSPTVASCQSCDEDDVSFALSVYRINTQNHSSECFQRF